MPALHGMVQFLVGAVYSDDEGRWRHGTLALKAASQGKRVGLVELVYGL